MGQGGIIFDGFPRKADNQRGTQGDAGDFTAQLGDQITDLLFRASAFHGAQNRIGDVLDRYVQIFADFGLIPDQGDEAVGDAVRIGVEQPYPA